jgi:hypothetical protein
MTTQEIEDLLMVGAFMEVKNLFPYQNDGVYIGEDEEGGFDYVEGINWYSPDTDWNTLMKVCKKIIEMYFAERERIFSGLHACDIKATYKACVEFIKFWNDDTKKKLTWNK